MIDPRNLGWLEKILFAFWASIKANLYCMFHWHCEYRIETTHRRTGEEDVRFVGVVKHHEGLTKVVRAYYGRSLLPLHKEFIK